MKQLEILIIFAKNLVHGQVKTRLASTVGHDIAYNVYKDLIAHTITVTKKIMTDKIVYYSDKVETDDAWNDGFMKEKQQGTDLGERIANSYKAMFQQGYTKAVIIGTDCPALNEHIIRNAFVSLDHYDIVIGPAFDGGYYLLGMKKLHAFLFDNVEWSTNTVFETTLAKCNKLGLSHFVLPTLHDIDEEQDMAHLEKTER